MPQKVLKFTGINRMVNEFNSTGACEELINLRPEIGGGYRVVKPKSIKTSGVEYVSFHEHTFGEVYNQIAVTSTGAVVWVNPKTGGPITITKEFTSVNTTLSSAGNVLVAYNEDEKKQLVYKFEDDAYSKYDVGINPITDIYVHYDYDYDFPPSSVADAEGEGVVGDFKDAMYKAASAFYSKYPNGLCGVSVVGCSYELEDGSEVWSTAFTVANATRIPNFSEPKLNTTDRYVVVYGARAASLKITFGDIDTKNVKKVNIYASKPVLPYDIKYGAASNHTVVKLPLDETNLDGELLYYQGSVDPTKNTATFSLKFGKELTGEKIMHVNSGCVERIGNCVSYNNRFHFFRSEVQHVIQIPTVSRINTDDRYQSDFWVAYVKINNKWQRIGHSYEFPADSQNDFIYPMSGIKQIAFVKTGANKAVAPMDQMFYVDMSDSSAYNYSYAFDVTPSLESASSFYDEISKTNQHLADNIKTKVFWKNEINAINVSAQYNPFVFPVEYSYSFSGEIHDIATSYLPISSTQVGQYPLSVFTSNGIFALEQGDGSVLYSNIIPLQPLVTEGKATATPIGTFFVSSQNLYILSGREAINMSYVLNGERELGIRESDAYKKLICSGTGGLYNFSTLLSSVDFEQFITNVVLTYDQLHNELYISSKNPAIKYSYVLNLNTKLYHKVAKKYAGTQNGARYAIEAVGDSKNLVDMYIESTSEQPVLLQSRPMPLDVLYTHIQRLILLIDTKLSGAAQNLCISVFGSDNLNDWKCIITSQKHDTVLRQIRTNKAAKSYRDYVIIINGYVDTHTDISEIIADYTVVNRRLG